MQALGALLPKIIPAALSGAGFIGNWLNNRKVNQRQDFLTKLGEDPNKMNAYVSQFQKPLQAGLTQNVGNATQAYLGERGLSESPTVSADVFAQALAPYQQQQQQTGIAEALASLGLIPKTGNPPSDVSGPLAMLMKQFAPKTANPTSGIDPSTLDSPAGTIGGMDPSILFGGADNVDWGTMASAGG
jgi:hypothetical protein